MKKFSMANRVNDIWNLPLTRLHRNRVYLLEREFRYERKQTMEYRKERAEKQKKNNNRPWSCSITCLVCKERGYLRGY